MRILTIAAFAALLSSAQPAETDASKRLDAAAIVMEEIMGTPDRGIPQDLLNNAECIVVVPGLKKGAFIIGGRYGRGFVSCRQPDRVGWSAPGGVRVEGGSFGFQIGGAETDVVMLVMNKRGAEKMLKSRFTVGADASVAAGPVGRDTSAQTDAMMRAQILTWSRQRGVFGGIALNGATMRDDVQSNRELYGKEYKNIDIIKNKVSPPESAKPFLTALNRYSSRK